METFINSYGIITNHIDKILDNLFIGSSNAGKNKELLKQNGITAKVNVAEDLNNAEIENILSYKIGLIDGEIKDGIEKAFNLVIKLLCLGHKVLVYSHEGCSRSVSIIITVLSFLKEQDIDASFNELRNKRPGVVLKEYFYNDIRQILRFSKIKTQKSKLGLASNFQDEVDNISSIWNIFKDVVEKWVVVDSGSIDGTQQKLKDLVGDKLVLIESDMIKQNGYGFSRTKLVELSEGMDWVLIWDGDERMSKEDVLKLKVLLDTNLDVEIIQLPRCQFHALDETIVEYGIGGETGHDWKEALKINPDWQSRLVKRIMVDGKSKIQFYRRVHEWVRGSDKIRKYINDPIIRHFRQLKTVERKQFIDDLCNKLYNEDKNNEGTWKCN